MNVEWKADQKLQTQNPLLSRCYPCMTICIFLIEKSPTALLDMHHFTCGISSLLRSINLILFACTHHLSTSLALTICQYRLLTPDLKLNCFTNPFLHSLSAGFIWIAMHINCISLARRTHELTILQKTGKLLESAVKQQPLTGISSKLTR